MRTIGFTPASAPVSKKSKKGKQEDWKPVASDLASAPPPCEVNVSLAAPTIAHLTNRIDKALKSQWRRDQTCHFFQINRSYEKLPNGSPYEILTIRDIKDMIRPLVENGWYIELEFRTKQRLSCDQRETYHATPDFLDDTTHDKYRDSTELRIYRVNPNKGYVARSYFFWPIAIVPALLAVLAVLHFSGFEDTDDRGMGIAISIVVGLVATALTGIAGSIERIKFRSADPDKCGPLVKQKSIG